MRIHFFVAPLFGRYSAVQVTAAYSRPQAYVGAYAGRRQTCGESTQYAVSVVGFRGSGRLSQDTSG